MARTVYTAPISGYAVTAAGVPPPGWTERFATDSLTFEVGVAGVIRTKASALAHFATSYDTAPSTVGYHRAKALCTPKIASSSTIAPLVWVRGSGGTTTVPGNGYAARLSPPGTSGNAGSLEIIVNNGTVKASVATAGITTNQKWYLEVEADGWIVRARAWADGAAIPAWGSAGTLSWDFNAESASQKLASGWAGLGHYRTSGFETYFHAFEVETDDGIAPNARPGAPTMGHTAVTSSEATITRVAGVDPEGDAIVATRLQVATSADFTSGIVYDSGASGEAPFTSKSRSALTPATQHWYRAADYDAGGAGAWSAVGDFTTSAANTAPTISIDQGDSGTLELGTTLQLTATVADLEDNPDPSPTWSTSDAAIATVSAAGLVTAVAIGSVTITAAVVDSGGLPASDTYLLTITQPEDPPGAGDPTSDAGDPADPTAWRKAWDVDAGWARTESDDYMTARYGRPGGQGAHDHALIGRIEVGEGLGFEIASDVLLGCDGDPWFYYRFMGARYQAAGVGAVGGGLRTAADEWGISAAIRADGLWSGPGGYTSGGTTYTRGAGSGSLQITQMRAGGLRSALATLALPQVQATSNREPITPEPWYRVRLRVDKLNAYQVRIRALVTGANIPLPTLAGWHIDTTLGSQAEPVTLPCGIAGYTSQKGGDLFSDGWRRFRNLEVTNFGGSCPTTPPDPEEPWTPTPPDEEPPPLADPEEPSLLWPTLGAQTGVCDPLVAIYWRHQEEDTSLTYAVAYAPAGSTAWTELATGLTVGSYAWDSTAIAPGSYQIRLTTSGQSDGVAWTREVVSDPFSVGATTAVDLARAPINPTRAANLEIWSDAPCGCGRRLGFLRPIEGFSTEQLEGQERLTFTVPLASAGWPHIQEKRVVRVVYANTTYEEWRVLRVAPRMGPDGSLVGGVECEAMLYDLGSGITEQIQANGQVEHLFDLFDLTPAAHLGKILTFARACFRVGTVEDTEPRHLEYHGKTPLAMIQELAVATGLELDVYRTASGHYRVDLVKEIGSREPVAVLRTRRNTRELERSGDAGESFQRAIPLGAESDGHRLTMAGARWQVTAIAGDWLTLAGGPIAFDDQLDGLWAELARDSAVRTEITATEYALQRIQVASAAGIEAGDLIHLRRTELGTELTYLERPDARATYGGAEGAYAWRTPLEAGDIPGIDNLVENPFLGQWTGATPLPTNWLAVGGATITRNFLSLYRRFGGSSARIEAAGAGAGLETPFYPVNPTAARPFGAAQIAAFVRSGRVRLELVVSDGATETTLPRSTDTPAEAITSLLNQWTDGDKTLAIAGVDLHKWADLGLAGPVDRFKLRITSSGGAAEWYLDAAQFTRDASGHETYYEGMASNDLHRRANKYLREKGTPLLAYRGRFVDLQRIAAGAFPHDALRKGARVRLVSVEPGFSEDTRVRIVGLRRNLMVEGETDVNLGTLKPDLTQIVIDAVALPVRSSTALPPTKPPTSDPPPPTQTVSAGALSGFGVRQVTTSAGTFHELYWSHNQAVQDGAFTVDIDVDDGTGPGTLAAGRSAKLEHGGTDSTALAGSFRERVYPCSDTRLQELEPTNGGTACSWLTHSYTVTLRENGSAVTTYTAEIFGRYEGASMV